MASDARHPDGSERPRWEQRPRHTVAARQRAGITPEKRPATQRGLGRPWVAPARRRLHLPRPHMTTSGAAQAASRHTEQVGEAVETRAVEAARQKKAGKKSIQSTSRPGTHQRQAYAHGGHKTPAHTEGPRSRHRKSNKRNKTGYKPLNGKPPNAHPPPPDPPPHRATKSASRPTPSTRINSGR